MDTIITFHCVDTGVREVYRYSYAPVVPRIGEYVHLQESGGLLVVSEIFHVMYSDSTEVTIHVKRSDR